MGLATADGEPGNCAYVPAPASAGMGLSIDASPFVAGSMFSATTPVVPLFSGTDDRGPPAEGGAAAAACMFAALMARRSPFSPTGPAIDEACAWLVLLKLLPTLGGTALATAEALAADSGSGDDPACMVYNQRPVDILSHAHSLLVMRDAPRVESQCFRQRSS